VIAEGCGASDAVFPGPITIFGLVDVDFLLLVLPVVSDSSVIVGAISATFFSKRITGFFLRGVFNLSFFIS